MKEAAETIKMEQTRTHMLEVVSLRDRLREYDRDLVGDVEEFNKKGEKLFLDAGIVLDPVTRDIVELIIKDKIRDIAAAVSVCLFY